MMICWLVVYLFVVVGLPVMTVLMVFIVIKASAVTCAEADDTDD